MDITIFFKSARTGMESRLDLQIISCFLFLIQIHKYDRLDILETNFKPAVLEGKSVHKPETLLCCGGGRRSSLGLWEAIARSYWKLYGRML